MSDYDGGGYDYYGGDDYYEDEGGYSDEGYDDENEEYYKQHLGRKNYNYLGKKTNRDYNYNEEKNDYDKDSNSKLEKYGEEGDEFEDGEEGDEFEDEEEGDEFEDEDEDEERNEKEDDNDEEEEEDSYKFNCETGDIGEKIVYDDLKNSISKGEIKWANKKGESFKPYDFKIKKGNKTIYIDAKSTIFEKGQEPSPIITANEQEFIDNLGKNEKYVIARVYNARSENPKIVYYDAQTLEKIKNPI